jgi:hypothetical protein
MIGFISIFNSDVRAGNFDALLITEGLQAAGDLG